MACEDKRLERYRTKVERRDITFVKKRRRNIIKFERDERHEEDKVETSALERRKEGLKEEDEEGGREGMC